MEGYGADLLVSQLADTRRLSASSLSERLAVLASFDPARLVGEPEGRRVAKLLCDPVAIPRGGTGYTLGERHRIESLIRILERGGMAELARVRRGIEPDHDSALQRALDRVTLGLPVDLDALDAGELVAALDVWRWVTDALAGARLSREVTLTPGKDEIEGRLALLDVTRAVRRLASSPVYGRDAELARLHEFRRGPDDGSLATLVVYGIGGVGKSTLMARFVMDLYEEGLRAPDDAQAWAYLDLDRPTLTSARPLPLLLDIARQVAAQSPRWRRILDREQVVLRLRSVGAGVESADATSHVAEAHALGGSISNLIGRSSLVVVVDTFEELGRSDRFDEDLLEMFEALSNSLRGRMRLIVSGRAPATAFVAQAGADRVIHLAALPSDAAIDLLQRLVVEESAGVAPVLADDLAGRLVELVGGIPLTLRLAARVIALEGVDAVVEESRHAALMGAVRDEIVKGFLYQRVLDHVRSPDPRRLDSLRAIAKAALVLRVVTVPLVRRVLLPAIGHDDDAALFFGDLAREVALGEEVGGVLRLREDLRQPALAALKLTDRALVDRVRDLAIAYYDKEGRDDPGAADERAYHLAARGDAADLPSEALARLSPWIADFPPATADLVRAAATDTSRFTQVTAVDRRERSLLLKADHALRSGQITQARELVTSSPAPSHAHSETFRFASRLAEAEGDLPAALAAEREGIDRARAEDDPDRIAASVSRAAGIAERLHLATEAETLLSEAIEDPLLAGRVDLRLELTLNRINLRERTGGETVTSRWTQGLAARTLLRRHLDEVGTTSGALVRLLAAAFGREEPARVRDALRVVGLGHDENPARVSALVDAVAEWDAGCTPPGRLADAANLPVTDRSPHGLRRAWAVLTGLGVDAGALIDRLWAEDEPTPSVIESARRLYLWWGVVVQDPGMPPSRMATGAHLDPGASPEPAGSSVDVDWESAGVLRLEEAILTAYPTTTQLRVLADRAGVDVGRISWSTSTRRGARELLNLAVRGGHLDELVSAIVADPEAASVRPLVQDIVGSTWLSNHGFDPDGGTI